MRRIASITMILCMTLIAGPAWSARDVPNGAKAEDAYRIVMELWRDGKFDPMYDHSRAASHKSLPKVKFVSRMKAAPLRLQCCWQTLQNMEIKKRSTKTVDVSADLGFDVVRAPKKNKGEKPLRMGSSITRRHTFTLRWSEGEWRFDLGAVLRAVENR